MREKKELRKYRRNKWHLVICPRGGHREKRNILFASPCKEEAGMAAGAKRTFHSKDFFHIE